MDIFDQIREEKKDIFDQIEAVGQYGLRADGTPKGPGFLGEMRGPSGKVSTEISIGVNLGGKETQIPTLVPTLTKDEINYLTGGGKPTMEIVNKAVEHARKRISEGKSPFAETTESKGDIFDRIIPDQPEKSFAEEAMEEAIRTGGGFVPEALAAEQGVDIGSQMPAEIRAIPPTIAQLFTSQVPFAKYLTEEGRKELEGKFFPRGTTTDPEELAIIGKELRGEIPEKISPYESLSQETMDALTFMAFPKALKMAGAMAETYLPKKLVQILNRQIKLPWGVKPKPTEVPKGKGPVEISPEGEPIYPPGVKPVIEELPKPRAVETPEAPPVARAKEPLPREEIPPTAQHLELMPEEYPKIKSVAVKQDGKIYTDHVHGEIIAENKLNPEKAIPGFVTKEGKFVEQYPKEKPPVIEKAPPIKEGMAEPSVSIEQLEKNPAFADYVIKRPEIHEPGVLARAKEISKTVKIEPPEVAAPLPPKLPGDVLRYSGEIRELRDIVQRGEPGKKIGLETGETASWSSSYPPFMSNKGWTKIQVLQAIDKGMKGEKLGGRQQEIWDAARKEARGIFRDRIGEQKKERLAPIKTGELNIGDKIKVKGEVLKVTKKTPEEIVIKNGQEYHLDPYFDAIEGKHISKAPPSIESLEAQVKGGPAGPLPEIETLPKSLGAGARVPKYAEGSSINLERLNTSEEVKLYTNSLTRQIEEKIGKKKISWEETRTKAEELGWDVGALEKAWKRKGAFSAAEIDAARQTNLNAISELHEMLRTLPAERTGYTPEMRAKLLDAMDSIKVTSQASAEAGRALNIHKKILSKDPAFKEASEINRALKALTGKGVQRTDTIIDTLRQINFNDPKEVNHFIYNVTKNKWQKLSDGAFELWINGLLSNPLTHIVNTTSNALTMAFQYPERLLGAGIEAGRALITKTPRERFAKETVQDIFSFTKGLQDGTKKFLDAMVKGEKVSKLETGKGYVSPLPSKVQKVLPGRALMAEDAFFKGFIENQELNRLALRKAMQEGLKGEGQKQRVIDLLKNPTEEMLEQATKRGEYLTYQKELGKVGKFVLKARDNIPGLKYFIPFVRTPANIAKFALERTPLNIPRIGYKVAKGELRGGEFSDEAAKALVGSLLGGSTYLLAQQGMITGGGPKGKAERDELFRTGWLPYAVKLGDKYYSFARLEPLGSILGMAADFSEIQEKMKEDEKFNVGLGIAASIQKNISSKTFLQGFSRISDFLSDPGRYEEKQIESLLGSLVPAVAGGVARAIDPELRDAKGIIDTIKSRIPGVSETVAPKLNIWGEPIERPGTAISRFISPVQISEEKGSPIDYELTKLKINIGMPSKKFGNSDLTEDEYSELVSLSGQKSKEELNRLIDRNSYKRLTDEEKEKVIKGIVSDNRAEGKRLLFRKMDAERKKEIKKGKE